MKIFISHSQKDKTVAKEFKKLFESFAKIYPGKQEVFLSSDISDDQIKTGQWKDDFEKNLKESNVFVVLVTPNSLHSTWVTYEIGYALALEGTTEGKGIKKIIPIGIRCVSPDSFFLNGYNMQIVKEKQDIIKLLNRIFGSTEKFNEIWCKENEEKIKKLLVQCIERCVYFVGSNPVSETGKEEWKTSLIDDFLERLTTELLKKPGIKVSSFPEVPEVGRKVFEAAIKVCPEKYEISGLYQFDKIAEGKEIDPKTWKQTLDGFRQFYLANKSSMIIIGGKDHTEDEYNVAKEKCSHMEFFPLPCMGGLGEKLFNKNNELYKKSFHPCIYCNYKDKEKCDQIEAFVKRLGKYIYINDEDEREF